jgi:hypothetical protein
MGKTGSVQDRLDSAVDTVISRATKLVNAAVVAQPLPCARTMRRGVAT